MSQAVKMTNLFTGATHTYNDIEELRQEAKADAGIAGIIDMLADAYEDGRAIGTYEWLLGVRVEPADDDL